MKIQSNERGDIALKIQSNVTSEIALKRAYINRRPHMQLMLTVDNEKTVIADTMYNETRGCPSWIWQYYIVLVVICKQRRVELTKKFIAFLQTREVRELIKSYSRKAHFTTDKPRAYNPKDYYEGLASQIYYAYVGDNYEYI